METTRVEELLDSLPDNENGVYEAGTGERESDISLSEETVLLLFRTS